MGDFNQRYKILNIATDAQNSVIENYLSYKKINQTIYISGQLPWQGKTLLEGKVGLSVTLKEAIFAARISAQQVIHQLNFACDKDLNLVEQCISLQGYVNCLPDFTEISEVVNGASDLIIEILCPIRKTV